MVCIKRKIYTKFDKLSLTNNSVAPGLYREADGLTAIRNFLEFYTVLKIHYYLDSDATVPYP